MEYRTIRTIIIHDSAFNFTPQSDEEREGSAWFMEFLRDAHGTYWPGIPEENFERMNAYRLIIATDGDPEDLKEKLCSFNLTQAFRENLQIDQSFLVPLIKPASDFKGQEFDILICRDEVFRMDTKHEVFLHPDSTVAPDYFHHFHESYKENARFFRMEQFAAETTATLKMYNIKRDKALENMGVDYQDVWKKAASTPAVESLAGFYEGALSFKGHPHPQDELIKKLQNYLKASLLAVAGRSVSNHKISKEMNAMRSILAGDFLSTLQSLRDDFHNIYPDEQEIRRQRPELNITQALDLIIREQVLVLEHRAVLYNALRTLHDVARETLSEPPSDYTI